MTTKKEWANREDLRLQLSELLKTEPLKTALEVCLAQDICLPQALTGTNDLLHQAALNGASREGYFRFYRQLLLLTQEPKPAVEEPKPWAHIKGQEK